MYTRNWNCIVLMKDHCLSDPKLDTSLDMDGNTVAVPQGAPIKMNQYSSSSFSQSEYLVYKESQARIRYLLKMNFKWGGHAEMEEEDILYYYILYSQMRSTSNDLQIGSISWTKSGKADFKAFCRQYRLECLWYMLASMVVFDQHCLPKVKFWGTAAGCQIVTKYLMSLDCIRPS